MIPDDIVIVIGRRFGSGGRRLGKILSKRLSLAYYDREILSEAAMRFGFDKNIFLQTDEKKPSLLRSLLTTSPGVSGEFSNGGLTREQLYKAQGEVIRDLASRGGSVFVGRSADYILREHPHLFSIFLHAPVEYRVGKILERNDARCASEAEEMARKMDRNREGFYNYFTGRKWGSADNYHLTIDTSLIAEDEIADMVITYLEGRFRN